MEEQRRKRKLNKKDFMRLAFLCAIVFIFPIMIFAGCSDGTDNTGEVLAVEGRVLFGDAPLADVEVLKNGHAFSPSLHTDSDGTFKAQGLTAGDMLTFRKEGYNILSYSVLHSASGVEIVAETAVDESVYYEITASVSGNGKVFVNDVEYTGAPVKVRANSTLVASVNLRFEAGEDSMLKSVKAGNANIQISPETTFETVKNVKLTIEFEKYYLLTVTSEVAELCKVSKHFAGDEVTLHAPDKTDEALVFAGWRKDGAIVNANADYEFDMPAKNTAIEAKYWGQPDACELTLQNYVLSWTAVDGATAYKLLIDGEIVASFDADGEALREADLATYFAASGEYSVAIGAEGQNDDGFDFYVVSADIIVDFSAPLTAPYLEAILEAGDKIYYVFQVSAADFEGVALYLNAGFVAEYLISSQNEKIETAEWADKVSVKVDVTEIADETGEYIFTSKGIYGGERSEESAGASFVKKGLTAAVSELSFDKDALKLAWVCEGESTVFTVFLNGVLIAENLEETEYILSASLFAASGTYVISVVACANFCVPSLPEEISFEWA